MTATPAIERTVSLSMADAEQAIRAALADQGFGVLTEIDIAATLKAKIGVERAPLKILGACNPGFADQALRLEPSVALLLPCNVVLAATDGGTRVSIADPRTMMSDPSFSELADGAAAKLIAAIEALPD